MPVGSSQKSSIDFLLSGPPSQAQKVSIEPKTITKTSNIITKKRQLIRPKNPKFSLTILQQPSHAKVSPRPPSRVFPPFSEHRPIHPPPVLQLKVDDFRSKYDNSNFLTDDFLNQLYNENDPRSLERIEELKIIKEMRLFKIPSWTHYSTFFVTARLQTVKGTNEKMLFNNKSEKSIDDLLIGTKVCSGMPISLRSSSPANSFLKKSLPNEKPKASNYAITFVFSDLSVRKIGNFSLNFDLFEVYKGKIYHRSEITSDEFTVYTPKKFPGSFPSTALTSFLYKHGARIRQRKRSTPSSTVRKFDEIDDQNDEYDRYPTSSSSSSMTKTSSNSSHNSKLPPNKLPKIHEQPYTPYQQSHPPSQLTQQQQQHHHHQHHPHARQIFSQQTASTTPSSISSSSSGVFTELPSVEHFHESALNFSQPSYKRALTRPQPQPQSVYPSIMYTTSAPAPPPPPPPPGLLQHQLHPQSQQVQGVTAAPGHTAYVQHIPIPAAGAHFYQPAYGPIMQQQPLPPQSIHVAAQQQSVQRQQLQPGHSGNNSNNNNLIQGQGSPRRYYYGGQ